MGISLGIVGLGSFGSSFVRLFKAHPLVSRIALCDREPDRLKRFAEMDELKDKFDAKDAYTSLDDICASDLDALAIITQPWLHAPQAVQAMESGKHVYSAVPIISLPDGEEILDWCNRLVETCTTTGKHYMLGETTCYRPQTMYCRRKAAEGAFGHFTYAEGEYFHDFDSPFSNLIKVQESRLNSQAGDEWRERAKVYEKRGVQGGPMHYPTHSTSGPISVMKAHATKVCCWGYNDPTGHEYFGGQFSNETALFQMSNGATMRICEHRQIGRRNSEIFRVFGNEASFAENTWHTKSDATELTVEDMRDPLPQEVADAYAAGQEGDIYGGHGGSHAYLVHEFVEAVAQDRHPLINVWEAARYMSAGVMAHQSALKDGEVLDVPDWGDAP